jgi:hypothetical protein
MIEPLRAMVSEHIDLLVFSFSVFYNSLSVSMLLGDAGVVSQWYAMLCYALF